MILKMDGTRYTPEELNAREAVSDELKALHEDIDTHSADINNKISEFIGKDVVTLFHKPRCPICDQTLCMIKFELPGGFSVIWGCNSDECAKVFAEQAETLPFDQIWSPDA